MKTLQVDACKTVSASWTNFDDFHSVVWAGNCIDLTLIHCSCVLKSTQLVRFIFGALFCDIGTSGLALKVARAEGEPFELTTGVDVVRAEQPDVEIRDDIDQVCFHFFSFFFFFGFKVISNLNF